ISPNINRYQHHRVVTENIDNFDSNGVRPLDRVDMRSGDQLQVPVLAGAETLPFVLENEAASPAFLEFRQAQLRLGRLKARQVAVDATAFGDPDDFLAAHIVEVHRPVVDPVGPMPGQHVGADYAVLILAYFDQLA